MIRISLLALTCLGGLISLSSAQNGPPPAKVEIRMLAFSPDQRMDDVFAQDPAAEPTAVSVPAPIKTYLNQQFTAMEIKSRKIVFTSKPDRASLGREGEIVAEVSLPDKVNSAILLFLPGKPGGKTKYQALVVDDSKTSFPGGTFIGINLSAIPVRLMLEQKVFDFQPGKFVLISEIPTRAGQQIGMRAAALNKNEWMPIASSIWSHPGKARSVLIFYQDPASGNIQLRAVDDVAPREPAPVEGTQPK